MRYFKRGSHINNLVDIKYYSNLVSLRNVVEIGCDRFFQKRKAPKVDLYLISNAVSSPIAKGSDSIPLKIKFGTKNASLTDSAQFGMEPLVLESNKMVYCYLPSFRGEKPDSRHMNQFFHCEAELRGNLKTAIGTAEKLVKHLVNSVLVNNESGKYIFKKNNFHFARLFLSTSFPQITFDEAVALLGKSGHSKKIIYRDYGRILTNDAELEIVKSVGNGKTPVWVTHYDRDTAAFYQNPDPNNPEKVLNADLLFPSLNGSVGGEIIGLGERQDDPKSMVISMKRQGIKTLQQYSWYINLRKHPKYKKTSGFGLGVDRFIAWLLASDNIQDVSLFPVLKGTKTVY